MRASSPVDTVRYGPDVGTEGELRLLGQLADKRVLELGCGSGEASVAFAREGAHVIGVDLSGEQLVQARRLAEEAGVKIELRHADLADLAFVRADSIDLVFSAYALDLVDDLPRVFRQVHRVLKPAAPLVFSLPHPLAALVESPEEPGGPLVLRRSYFDGSPVGPAPAPRWGGHHHTISELFTALGRANFRVDTILEPAPRAEGPRSAQWHEAFHWVPPTLVMRARKEGL